MQHKQSIAAAIGLGCALIAGVATAAAPDWSKVPGKDITVFHPGVASIEWIEGTEHRAGARALRRGERCADCHSEETANMGETIVADRKLEPTPIKGRAAFIPMTVQATHDGRHLYLRFTWKQPPGGAAKMDNANRVKLSIMMAGNKVERANLFGCWGACHNDLRTMPGAKSKDRTKYISNANLAGGVYYDLLQWTSQGKIHDGHVVDRRVMDGGKALVEAKGALVGDTWTVTFVRKLVGTAPGDITLESGKTYYIGFAIHDNHSLGRFHQVSLDLHLGIDAAGDIVARKH